MVVASLTGYLGDGFGVYRQAMNGGWKFDRQQKHYTGPVSAVLPALSVLKDGSVPYYVDDSVTALLETLQCEKEAALDAADDRANAVDGLLAQYGHSLYPYQRTGIRWLSPRTSALLGDDMGLGKTLQALVAAPVGAPILVICPAVAKGVWVREANKWRPDLTAVALKGRKSFRWPSSGEMVVLNYDILPAECGEAPKGLVLVADEAHAVKNSKAARTKKFRAISKATRRAGGCVWLLTGTPLLNRPPELWALLTAAGLEIETFGSWPSFAKLMGGEQVSFRARGRTVTCWEWTGRPAPQVPGMLRKAMLRRLKEEVLKDLPALRYETIEVNGLSATLTKQLDAALAKIAPQLESAERVANSTAGLESIPFELISKVGTAVALAKIPAMLQMVEEHEEADEPLVVFSAHRAPVDALADREGWAVITGDTSHDRRTEIQDAFQAGKLKGVAATIQAGGVAVTLTRASRAVFVDRLYTPALNRQARDRIYRIGQDRGVLITTLVAEHALDRRVNELLTIKEQLIAETVDAARVDGDRDVAGEELDVLSGVEASDLETMAAEYEARLAELTAELDAEALAKAKAKELQKLNDKIAKRCGLWDLGSNKAEDVRRAAKTDEERTAIAAVKKLTALDPDHAAEENNVGWNKADGYVGHALATLADAGLTDAGWRLARTIVKKYHGQVG
jgi:SWI/SNF-related matrix-associated actin-dependent regulator 1 of chromatin subfamily A